MLPRPAAVPAASRILLRGSAASVPAVGRRPASGTSGTTLPTRPAVIRSLLPRRSRRRPVVLLTPPPNISPHWPSLSLRPWPPRPPSPPTRRPGVGWYHASAAPRSPVNHDSSNNNNSALPLMDQQLQARQEKLERQLEEAIHAYQRLTQKSASPSPADDPTDDDASFQEMVHALVNVRTVYEELGYWDQALECEERLAILWSSHSATDDPPSAKDTTAMREMAQSWYRRGRYHMHMGLPVDAGRCYRQALEDYTALYDGDAASSDDDDDHVTWHADKGHVLMSLAGIQYTQGEHAKALHQLQTQAEPHFRRHQEHSPPHSSSDSPPAHNNNSNETEHRPHPDLFQCLQHQGLVCRGMEDYEQALDLYQQAYAVLQSTLARDPAWAASDDGRAQLQAIQFDMADMHLVLRHLDEALALYQTIWETECGSSASGGAPSSSSAANDLEGLVWHNIGRIYAEQGKNDLAVATLRQAVAAKTAWYGAHHAQVAKTLQVLGAVYVRQNQRFEALECFSQCLDAARREAQGDNSHPAVLLALRNLALVEGKQVPRWGSGGTDDDNGDDDGDAILPPSDKS